MHSADKAITIIFRGTRGSYPTPGADTVLYGGNTTCQEIHAGGRLIIFDSGTGIISLGRELLQKQPVQPIALFFSHNHHDHIDGILYFKPAYMPTTTMHIFGPADVPGGIMDALEIISAPAAHPVQIANMGMHYTCDLLAGGEIVVWSPEEAAPRFAAKGEKPGTEDVVIKVLRNALHPLEGVLNFRLEYAGKSYVYATDVEGDVENGDPILADFARGADLLAHDGQYTCQEYQSHRGWGHSSIEMAIRTAEIAGARRLAIIHHDPEHSDADLSAMETSAQQTYSTIFFAREGQTIVL